MSHMSQVSFTLEKARYWLQPTTDLNGTQVSRLMDRIFSTTLVLESIFFWMSGVALNEDSCISTTNQETYSLAKLSQASSLV